MQCPTIRLTGPGHFTGASKEEARNNMKDPKIIKTFLKSVFINRPPAPSLVDKRETDGKGKKTCSLSRKSVEVWGTRALFAITALFFFAV